MDVIRRESSGWVFGGSAFHHILAIRRNVEAERDVVTVQLVLETVQSAVQVTLVRESTQF